MVDGNQNGWNEYSRLVLKELETLGDGIESLRGELQDVKQELTKMQVREDKVDEIRQWKERVDDVCSPTQLKDVVSEIENLKTFKTTAITIFTAIQFGMGFLIWYLNVFGKS